MFLWNLCFLTLVWPSPFWTMLKKMHNLKNSLSLSARTNHGFLYTSGARNENIGPLFNTNIPQISRKCGLRNHFWPLGIAFLMRNMRKRVITFKNIRAIFLCSFCLGKNGFRPHVCSCFDSTQAMPIVQSLVVLHFLSAVRISWSLTTHQIYWLD